MIKAVLVHRGKAEHTFHGAASSLQQQGQAHFRQHVATVVGGRAIHAHANIHARVQHLPYRGDACSHQKLQVCTLTICRFNTPTSGTCNSSILEMQRHRKGRGEAREASVEV